MPDDEQKSESEPESKEPEHKPIEDRPPPAKIETIEESRERPKGSES